MCVCVYKVSYYVMRQAHSFTKYGGKNAVWNWIVYDLPVVEISLATVNNFSPFFVFHRVEKNVGNGVIVYSIKHTHKPG